MRGRIFISYRRDDAPADARSIRDRLARKFGDASVFMDVDSLFAGQRFDQELDKALAQCEVLIAVIGRRWSDLLSEHRRAKKRDYVREEIGGALKREICIIPVLVGREGQLPPLPREEDLPTDLRNLLLYQKQGVAHETFGRDVDELINAIGTVLRQRRSETPWNLELPVKLEAPWKMKIPALGRSALIAGGVGLVAALTGTVLWASRSNPDSPSILKIDASAKKARDEEASYRPTPQNSRSVIDNNARGRFEYYERLAAGGNRSAMEQLGGFYEEGVNVPKNIPMAIVWYRKAADAGSEDAKAKLKKLGAN